MALIPSYTGSMLPGTDIYVEIMEMAAKFDAVNLAQGFPQDELSQPMADIAADSGLLREKQYAPLSGLPRLRTELARRAESRGLRYDPESEITVTIGCTEALATALLAVTPRNSEILTLEPFYDSYPGLARLAGARLVRAPLVNGDLDVATLRRASTSQTRVLLLNAPHNPSGFTLSEQSCAELARFAIERDLFVVSDEVYEEHTYDKPAVRIAAFPGMRERTVVCSSASKMLAAGGWRIGWAYAPREISEAIAFHHRHLAFSAPAPLQAAVADGLRRADETGYFERLRAEYQVRRDLLSATLSEAGLSPSSPRGGYFVTADTRPWGAGDDIDAFAKALIVRTGVAALPLGDFYADPAAAGTLMRFAFCKPLPVLQEAARRLSSGKKDVDGYRERAQRVGSA